MAERRMPTEEDYPNNSLGKSKIEKVTPTEPLKLRGDTKAKHSIWRSVRDEFVSEDAPSVGNYILWDIVIPALKNMISDMGHGAIDIALGTDSRRYRGRSSRGDSYVSYNRMYDDRDYYGGRKRRRRDWDDDYDDDYYPRSRRREEPSDIGFRYKEDADDVLEMMISYLERYPEIGVPVAYFYDKIGRTIPGNFTDEDWGWTDLSRTKVVPHGGRWYIDFPKVRPL